MCCAKMAVAIKMPFGMLSRMGLGNHVLDGVNIGTTWQTRLNRPCVVAMRPYVGLL